jgi:hypothetical protein
MRFATLRMDKDSRRPQGVFVAAYSLLESGELAPEDWKQTREILNWFQKYLPTPSRRRFSTGRAIFWFKSSADESIRQIWELVHLLRRHGHHVEIYKCRYLSNICYEDELQVAAYPSKDDGKVTVQ